MMQYKVLWVDDEVETVVPDKEILDRYHIQVVGTATCSVELENLIAKNEGAIDAIIVDANFNRNSRDLNLKRGERDLSGLKHALTLESAMKAKGYNVPFFIFTQRDFDVLYSEFYENELDEIEKDGRLIHKSQSYKALFTRIQEVVDRNNTPEYQLRCRYHKEFEAASNVEDAERLLMKGLLFEFKEEPKDVQDYFNPVRKIIENIISKCQSIGYLPKISLNGISKLLFEEGKEIEGFSLKKSIMDKALAHSLGFFLDITQDASHDKPDLKLGVTEYIRFRQNTNLYRSVLHIAMDMLLWFAELVSNEDLDPENIVCHYIDEGIVEIYRENGRSWYFIGNCQLQYQENIAEGQKVKIIKKVTNSQPFKVGIAFFASVNNYKIISVAQNDSITE